MTHAIDARALAAPASPFIKTLTPALARFSLTNSSDELRKIAQDQTPLLGTIALKNQTTVIYAKPNVGKTLITLHLLRQAIENERIGGEDCYYIAADDTPSGVLEKIELLQPYGVHVLAPSLKGFEAKQFPSLLSAMMEEGSASGKLVILDTLKKFANLMDKKESSAFADLSRRFVMKGGSLIGLAHTNKRTDAQGKPIFAGTSDIIDDFDCAYTIRELGERDGSNDRAVQFDNLKSRGDVEREVLFSYSADPEDTYAQRLESVRKVGENEITIWQLKEQEHRYDAVLAYIESLIRSGVTGKIAIAKAAAQITKTGKNMICSLIDTYTGSDPSIHRWTVEKLPRGERRYHLLEKPTAGTS